MHRVLVVCSRQVEALETADGPPQASEAATVSPVARDEERRAATAMAEFGDALLKDLAVWQFPINHLLGQESNQDLLEMTVCDNM
eukprot:s3266_g2.t1